MLSRHLYDATEIFRSLQQQKMQCFVKLGFYLLSFFYCNLPLLKKDLYRMIYALVDK